MRSRPEGFAIKTMSISSTDIADRPAEQRCLRERDAVVLAEVGLTDYYRQPREIAEHLASCTTSDVVLSLEFLADTGQVESATANGVSVHTQSLKS